MRIRSLAFVAALAATVGSAHAHRTIYAITYAGANLVMPATIAIVRGVPADVIVRGTFLDLSTGVECARRAVPRRRP